MFFYKTSSWFDQYDPYWYSRLFGFKAVYLCVIGFTANLIFSPPFAPLVLLVAAASFLIPELPSLNSYRKKDMVSLGYLIVQLVTINIFGATVIINWLFILTAFVWCYLLYRALAKAPQLFAIVSIWIMIGLISLEAINTGNWVVLLNLNLFILQFACIFFFASKLMPNLYYNVWLSTKLRALDDIIEGIQKSSIQDVYDYKHTATSQQVMPLLKNLKSFSKISQFDHEFDVFYYKLNYQLQSLDVHTIDMNSLSQNLLALRVGVKNQKKVSAFENTELSLYDQDILKIFESWNQLC